MDGGLSTEEMDHVRKYPADPLTDFVLKLEPAWSMEEDSPDQPSAVYSTVQPMSDNTFGSLLSSLNTSHACYLCSAAFVLVSNLELHLASVHGEKLHVVLPGSSTPERCTGDCNNTDIDKEEDIPSDQKRTMKKKVEDDDTGDKDGNKRGKQHVCDVCGKSFPRPNKLKSHQLIHTGAKPFICDVCSKGFNKACNLKIHKMMHDGDKPFVCDLCSKRFIREDFLKRHKMVHTGERPYKCPHCDRNFHLPGSLQDHVKSKHEGDRSHVCDACGAGFPRSGDLTMHRRRNHTGEKPFVCSVCGKGFVSSGELGKHCVSHTVEKPHVCSYCGKGFATSCDLGRHCLIHTGQRPHICPHCPSAFRLSGHLKRHMRTKHH